MPLITGALDLAQNTSIDARVKIDITHRQYCGLAVGEYIDYLVLNNTRWSNWLTDNVDPEDPWGSTSTETIQPCGKTVTITVTQQTDLNIISTTEPVGTPVVSVPSLSAYANRDFQTSKTVSDSNPNGGDSVTYTITVVNRDSTPTTLTKIKDTLPPGFSYDCYGPADQLTLPGMDPQYMIPAVGPCPDSDDNEIEWSMPPGGPPSRRAGWLP